MKSERNKTIDFSASTDEGKKYLSRCIFPDEKNAHNLTKDEFTNKIICSDTLKTMPLMPEKCIDLAVADPPYNMKKEFGTQKFSAMSDEAYVEYTARWLDALKPLLKDTATLYVCCDWKCSNEIYSELKKRFYVQNRITWQREKGRGSTKNWKNSMEDIWFATVSREYTFNSDAVKQRRRVIAPYKSDGKPKDWEETENGRWRNTFASNFWDDISVPYWSMAENTAHPTQKPEKLIAKLVLASSNEGDIVFDPFSGSGTTAVTAKKLNRKFIGIEREEEYCAWAQYRLEAAERDSTIQGYCDGVFWDRNSAGLQKRKK